MELSVIALDDAIARFGKEHPGVQSDALTDIVRTAVKLMNDDIAAMQQSLFSEVAELGNAVSAARDEIARIRSDQDFGDSSIPEATDELDAIVQHTASATETILDACEQIDARASAMPEQDAAALQDLTMRIFEACSFQDITGQRISKVVAALKMVEQRIERIVGTYAPGSRPVAPAPIEDPVKDPLLNGPQAPHAAMDQAEIDRLLTF